MLPWHIAPLEVTDGPADPEGDSGGQCAGIFSGLTGVGGGALAVSVMVSWLGMDEHVA